MIVRPKLLLDTNIYVDVADGRIRAEDWDQAERWIRNRCRYCVSFPTMKELLGKLARCGKRHFESNKKPLRILCEPGRPRFLPYPSVFALRTVLGLTSIARVGYPKNLPEEITSERIIEAVLDAPDKSSLQAGIPTRGRRGHKAHWVDLDGYDQHENVPQKEHGQLLQGIRDGTINPPDPIKWAKRILYDHREQLGEDGWTDQDNCRKLVSALDAAYKCEESLAAMAKNHNYDFERHATDWGDVMQLFYLCDPQVRFVTKDGNCRRRTRGSSQSSQIVLWEEFLAAIPQA